MATPAPKIPAGMGMMLKALGIEIDPQMILKVGDTVKEIAGRLEALERNQKTILANQVAILQLIGKETENGRTGNTTLALT